jgi:hypothetical protein
VLPEPQAAAALLTDTESKPKDEPQDGAGDALVEKASHELAVKTNQEIAEKHSQKLADKPDQELAGSPEDELKAEPRVGPEDGTRSGVQHDSDDKAKVELANDPKPQPDGPLRAKKDGEKLAAGPLFTFRTDVKGSWHHEKLERGREIQIAIENPSDSKTDTLVCDQVPRELLFRLAPQLRDGEYDYHDRIVFTASAGLDEDTVNDVVNVIIDCATKGQSLAMNMHLEAVRLIKIHCVLVRFGMQTEADNTLEALWELMGTKELTLGDVLWIWDTFGDTFRTSKDCPFTSLAQTRSDLHQYPQEQAQQNHKYHGSGEYVQMMAWQLVNMDAERRLNKDIKKAIGLEREPRHFFNMLKTRVEEFGLGREALTHTAEENREAVAGTLTAETAGELTAPVTTRDEVTPKQSAPQVHFSANEKTKAPLAATVPTKKAVGTSAGLKPMSPHQTSPHHGSSSKLRAAAQKAPQLTSAGLMNVSESGVPKAKPLASGKPEQTPNKIGGFSGFSCTPNSVAGLAGSKNVGHGFGAPVTSSKRTADDDGAAKRSKTGWSFGGLKQENSNDSPKPLSGFSNSEFPPQSNPLGNNFLTRTAFKAPMLTQLTTSGFNFNQTAQETPSSVGSSAPFQFGGGSSHAPAPQPLAFGSNFRQPVQQAPSGIGSSATHKFGGSPMNTPAFNTPSASENLFDAFSNPNVQNTSAGVFNTQPSPFGTSPFGNDANANNMFAPQHGTSSGRSASSGGGMARRFAAARSAKGTRKR